MKHLVKHKGWIRKVVKVRPLHPCPPPLPLNHPAGKPMHLPTGRIDNMPTYPAACLALRSFPSILGPPACQVLRVVYRHLRLCVASFGHRVWSKTRVHLHHHWSPWTCDEATDKKPPPRARRETDGACGPRAKLKCDVTGVNLH